jgi:signal transduction histidine kinase
MELKDLAGGRGTGLGLSLAYDIVKAHGGEIKVSSVEGEYIEFTVLLQVEPPLILLMKGKLL